MQKLKTPKLSINPKTRGNGKEGCARLARRPFRSATGRSPALSAEMNPGRVPCAIQISISLSKKLFRQTNRPKQLLRAAGITTQRVENLSQNFSRPALKHSSMDTTAPKDAWKTWKGNFSMAASGVAYTKARPIE